MSKRKRDDLDAEDQEGRAEKKGGAPDYRRQRQIADTFANATKQLGVAFKLGRAFERQKLGRRKKNAAREKKVEEVTRIDAEVAALKTLDTVLSAQNFLAKALLKIKAVATSEHLPAELRTPRPVSSNAAMLNVHARLCNSNPVKQAFPAAFAAVKRELGVIDAAAPEKRQKRLRAKDCEMQQIHASQPNGEEEDDDDVSPGSSEGEASFHSFSDDEDDDGEGAGSSSADIDDLERRLEEEGISRKKSSSKYDLAADLSQSEMEELSGVEAPRRAPSSGKSAFIPTLTMGGYISGGDSDIEDIEDSKPKKNRRGQRARQAIWEQKYGKTAKHLQSQDRKQGWDPKRGAVDGPRGNKSQDGSRFAKAANSLPLGRSRDMSRSGPDRNKPKKLTRDDSGPLHPSWEAAKRAKLKKSVPVAFQGKKISFD